MNKLVLMLLCASIGALSGSAELRVIQKKDKYGFADENGTEVVKPQYNAVSPFKDGLSKVRKGDKWGFIDETGKVVIPIQYDEIDEFNAEDIALVKKGKKKGYMRKDGTFVVKPDFDFIGGINPEGYIWVAKGKSIDVAKKGLYKYDKMILEPKYSNFGFYQKTDSVDYGDGNFFISSQAGEMKKSLDKLSLSDIPYIWTDVNYKRGIVDLDGKPVVKEQLYAMGAPVEGRVLAVQFGKKKNKYNFIVLGEKGGTKLFKKDFEKPFTEDDPVHGVYPFRNGTAQVCEAQGVTYLVDLNGNKVSETYTALQSTPAGVYIASASNGMGLINHTGSPLSGFDYEMILPVADKNASALAAKNRQGLCGFIDFAGKELAPFEYEDATTFCYGRGYVKKNGKWGVIDNKFSYLASPKWNDIMVATNDNVDLVWVKGDDSDAWKCLKLGKDVLVPGISYAEVSPFTPEGSAMVKAEDLYAVIDTEGGFIVPARFSTTEICQAALDSLKKSGKKQMTDTEAYRFNIYNHPDRHSYKLSQPVDANMWDY